MDGDVSPELITYYDRVQQIASEVLGHEFYRVLNEIPAWNQDHGNPQPEIAEPLYSRALDLFIEGCERFTRDTSQFEYLVTWRNWPTFNGMGHPGVREALLEQYIEFSEEYDACLQVLSQKCRTMGNQAIVDQCERQMKRLKELDRMIRNLSTPNQIVRDAR